MVENVIGLSNAPDVGTVVEYEGNRYRVNGWLCEQTPPDNAVSFNNIIDQIMYEAQQATGPDNKKLMFCHRSRAEYVHGSGTCGMIARLSEIKIVGRVSWPDEQIDHLREMAILRIGTSLH